MALLSKPVSPLMNIPTELRLQILGYLLLSPTPIVDLQKGVVSTAVLQVCKQLNAEGSPIVAKNIFRFNAAEAMISSLLAVPKANIQHVELDLVHVRALTEVDEQTYSQLGEGTLGVISTTPDGLSERCHYLGITCRPYELFVHERDFLQQFRQPSKISYMHHGLRGFSERWFRYVQQWRDAGLPKFKDFTVDIGSEFTRWISVKSDVYDPCSYSLTKAVPVLALSGATRLGITWAERTVVRGKGAQLLEALWDAFVNGNNPSPELAQLKAEVESGMDATYLVTERRLKDGVTFKE